MINRGKNAGRVLIIAGSDSGGGAGLQADIKTVTMLGGYAATAVTALTVQNTLGVFAIQPVSQDFVRAQAVAVLDDIGADIIKTGMLGDPETVELVAQILDEYSQIPAVIDPVMVAKGGASLLSSEATLAVTRLLIPRAALLTPNAPEAETLTGLDVRDLDGMRKAGRRLLDLGCKAVLMKGGHVEGDQVRDLLLSGSDETVICNPRIDTRHTHGTGCTLASACATGLAMGLTLKDAVQRASDYVHAAIGAAPGLGNGHGPLKHNWSLSRA
jgi:hydroxymethylpyrimidine/phosphomethylpyrimidine kinase